MEKAKVQIVLEGDDARLYKRISNKKQFLVAAMKMFEQDDKLRLIFFNDETVETQGKKSAAQISSTQESAKKPTQQSSGTVKKGW